MCYQFYSEIHGLQEQIWVLQIFREWQGQRANKICTGRVFKGKDIGLDVQELTECIENQNVKSLIY